jgi:hypothetical protein
VRLIRHQRKPVTEAEALKGRAYRRTYGSHAVLHLLTEVWVDSGTESFMFFDEPTVIPPNNGPVVL